MATIKEVDKYCSLCMDINCTECEYHDVHFRNVKKNLLATIRAFTTVEQSRKLAEILPLESADMYYQYVTPKSDKIKHNPEIGNPINALKWYNKGYTTSGKEPIRLDEYCVPCWSLAALLGVLPNGIIMNKDSQNGKYHFSSKHIGTYVTTDNPVDACVAMIEKLNELNLL